jgi:hypothetical protein
MKYLVVTDTDGQLRGINPAVITDVRQESPDVCSIHTNVVTYTIEVRGKLDDILAQLETLDTIKDATNVDMTYSLRPWVGVDIYGESLPLTDAHGKPLTPGDTEAKVNLGHPLPDAQDKFVGPLTGKKSGWTEVE